MAFAFGYVIGLLTLPVAVALFLCVEWGLEIRYMKRLEEESKQPNLKGPLN